MKANALAVPTVPIANIAKTMNIAAHAKNATTKVTAATMTVTAIRVIATIATVVVAAPATKSFVCLMINEAEREQCESVPALSSYSSCMSGVAVQAGHDEIGTEVGYQHAQECWRSAGSESVCSAAAYTSKVINAQVSLGSHPQ